MKRTLFFTILCLFAIFQTNTISAQGYLHASGKNIVDGDGNVFLLKGMGLGGWMVQEPYMMLAGGSAPAGQHSIFSDIEALIGIDNLQIYHQAWLENYMTEADVAELKASGFNSIRLPMHYNLYTLPIEDEPVVGQDTWLTTGFDLTDNLLAWCKKYEIYLILDLHAAPGGQGKDANISDYDSSKPSLWESAENRRKTVALWKKLAERYANETWIGGYDLINETNWSFGGANINGCNENTNTPLKELNGLIIAEIRKVDANHLIFIEGNCWAGNHNGLWPISDNNVALSFHRYWNDNTIGTIQGFINLSNQYNIPLWMGESGENNDKWYYDAVNLLEANNIGWAWWTWKKMESNSGSYSISAPSGYQELLNYWTNGGVKPNATAAFNTMMQLADAALLVNCTRNSGAIDALTAERPTCATVLHASISSLIQAENYCQMSGIQSETCTDTGGGYDIGWTDAADWLAYNVNIADTAEYLVKYRVSSLNGGGKLQLESFGGAEVYGTLDVPKTGAWQTWTTISHEVTLNAGKQTLALIIKTAGFNINWIQISKAIDISLVNKSSNEDKLDLFPNPCDDKVNVLTNNVEIESYSVVDMSGRILMKNTIELGNNSDSFAIDLSGLVSGAYVVMFQSKSEVICKRIVKK